MPLQYKAHYGDKAYSVHSKASVIAYPIIFMRAAQASASAGGATAGIYLVMEGPTEADMRALAEEAYDDLTARLAAVGYEILPGSDAAQHPKFAELERHVGNAHWASGTPDPYGKRVWFMVSSNRAPLLQKLDSWNGRFQFGLLPKLKEASRELGAMFVMPTLVLDFSSLGAVARSGSQGSTAWAGGRVQIMVKASSGAYMWSGGPRVGGLVATQFLPKNRDFVSPWPLQGRLINNARTLTPELTREMGGGRYDVFNVDMVNWRNQVRAAFRGYNVAMVNDIIASKAKNRPE